MIYHFKKWFFDMNLSKDTYIYFFLVEVRFLFFKKWNFTFHQFFQNSGTTTITKSLRLDNHNHGWEVLDINSKNLTIVPGNQILTIASNFNDLDINLKIYNIHYGISMNSLVINKKGRKIEWFPLPGFLRVSGNIIISEKVHRIEDAPAYIDHVYSNILPFNVPVKKMYWGRILNKEIRIIFSIAFSAKMKQWSRCIVMTNNQVFSLSEIQFEKISDLTDGKFTEKEENNYKLVASDGLTRLLMKIQRLKAVAGGAFINPGQYKNKNAYRILNMISKNPRGEKYISRAEVIFDHKDQSYKWDNLVCIDEYVLF